MYKKKKTFLYHKTQQFDANYYQGKILILFLCLKNRYIKRIFKAKKKKEENGAFVAPSGKSQLHFKFHPRFTQTSIYIFNSH